MFIFDFSSVLEAWPLFLHGLWLTCVLTAVGSLFGTLLGIACAWGRLHGASWLRIGVACYVELFRNTPFIIQIFFIFFGLAAIGLKMSAVTASLMSIVLNLGAYSCEIIRAGIEATPRGQIEAAQSLALNPRQIFTRVVVPPALSRVWPGLVSQLVIIMLASAVCGQISTEELSYSANLVASRSFRSFEAYIVVTACYLVLAVALREFLEWIGPRFVFGR